MPTLFQNRSLLLIGRDHLPELLIIGFLLLKDHIDKDVITTKLRRDIDHLLVGRIKINISPNIMREGECGRFLCGDAELRLPFF